MRGPELEGNCRFGAIRDSEFPVDVTQVKLDRVNAHLKPLGSLGVREAESDEPENFGLSWRERVLADRRRRSVVEH